MTLFLMFIVLSYTLGSIPFGVIVGKRFKQLDIREHGSKNTGATNAIRVLGKKLGFFVLFLDIAKGFLPVFLASHAGILGFQLLIIGIISILGHTFSPFINFRGGKGVATSLGVFLFFVPEVILLSVLIFIAIVYFTRYISLASITVAALFPCMVILIRGKERADVVVVGIVIAFYIIYKHKSNIKRLIQGNENKFSLK